MGSSLCSCLEPVYGPQYFNRFPLLKDSEGGEVSDTIDARAHLLVKWASKAQVWCVIDRKIPKLSWLLQASPGCWEETGCGG